MNIHAKGQNVLPMSVVEIIRHANHILVPHHSMKKDHYYQMRHRLLVGHPHARMVSAALLLRALIFQKLICGPFLTSSQMTIDTILASF